MPKQVRAFGQILQFPDDMSDDDMAKHIKNNEHVLNPDFKQPEGFSGLAKNVLTGTKQTGRMAGATIDAARNDLAGVEQYAKDNTISAEQNTPIEQRKLQSELSSIDRDQGALSQIGDTLKAAGRNPMGTAQMVAEQLPNTAVSLGGGYAGFKAGALAGSPFGPVGATIGGTLGFLSGMFLGNVLLEAGGKAIEKASDEDGFTPQDRKDSLREGAVKGAVITGVDAATFKLGGMVASRFGGEAIKAGARAEAKVLVDAGVDATSLTAINTALKSSPELFKAARVAGENAAIKALSTKSKIGILGGGAAMETLGEGVGEYAGEYAATGKGDVVDATIEALSSATMSVAETAYNYNKVKSGNDLSLQGIQKAAGSINDHDLKSGINDIQKSQSVDEAIQAATATVSKKPVTKDDVLRTVDPTLADIERLTGIKPSESIEQAINEAQQGLNADSISAQGLDKNIASSVDIEGQILTQPGVNLNEEEITKQNTKTTEKPLLLGKDTEIVLPDNTTIPAKWAVVDADNVKASIKEGINQPRDRARAASDMQIKGIANNPDYRRLSDSVLLDTGSPTLSHDGLIVGGNGRFEGVSQAHSQGTGNDYLRTLREDAINKGIDPALIDGMKKPVLVRQITQPFDTRKLAIASNSGTNMAYSGLELAKIDAGRMDGIEDLDITDSGDIALTGSNISKIRKSLVDYNTSEVAQMIGSDGALSQDGIKRVRNAILAKAYGNTETLGRMVESTDNDMRNVVGSLIKSAGHVAKVRSQIKLGAIPKEVDITDNLLGAVETLSQIRAQGQPLDNYLGQQDAFGDTLDDDSKQILQFVHDNLRSQKKLTDFIRTVYSQIANINQTTDDVFGDNVVPSKKDLIENAKPKEQQADQQGFFDKKSVEPVAKESKAQADNVGGDKSKFSRSPEERIKDREKAKQLEKGLVGQGFKFTITPSDVRDFTANDRSKENEADTAEKIAKIFGKRIVWIEAEGDFKINGVVIPSIKDTIFIDVTTDKYTHAVMGHELSHHMEHDVPAAYKDMVKSLEKVIKNHKGYAEKYGVDGADKAYIIKEIVGDIMGDNFTKPEFWNRVAEANPSAFKEIAKSILAWLKRLITNAKARSLGSEQWVTDAQKAQDIIAQAVAQYTDQASGKGSDKAKFHSAFHGSPHSFDKFTSDKIGTGEGAQAYGYGLYFASSKGVAQHYKNVLSKTTRKHITYKGKKLTDGYLSELRNNGTSAERHVLQLIPNNKIKSLNVIELLNERMVSNKKQADQYRERIKDRIAAEKDGRKVIATYSISDYEANVKSYESSASKYQEFIDSLKLEDEKKSGALYEVELAPEQDEYLLWDKPLSEQSDKVQEIIKNTDEYKSAKSRDAKNVEKGYDSIDNRNGDYFYKYVFGSVGDGDQDTSEFLHSLGIRGIKYLDGSSRGKGKGNYNYVIFNDEDVSITAKFSKATKNKDNEYIAAVENGDLETAQKMVDAAARDKGYISGADYRMMHQAPNREDYNLATIKESGIVPDDYWTHPHYYQSDSTERESFSKVNSAIDRQKRNGRKAALPVYRSVPKDVKDDNIRNGDWVTPSREYAKMEGESIPGGYRIISAIPNIDNLWWDANSINELGYDDGKEYAYKNTKNNRKLIDPVTYDDDGNIVPLSKRFNSRSDDVRFSRATKEIPETLNINGVDRPATNSEGKAIHPTEAGIRAFWEWFGDSKVVDDQGRPMVVSHFTDSEKIDEFKREFLGSNTSGNTDQEQALKMAKLGFWFSDSDIRYTPEKKGGMLADYKHDFYLSISNPIEFEDFDEMWSESDFYGDEQEWLDKLRRFKRDGVIVIDDTELGGTSFVALNSSQIKSIDNKGEFSNDNPDIRFSFAGKNSDTADQHNLSLAKELLIQDKDAETVRQDTGWFKGSDGKWRYEINDSDAKITSNLKNLKNGGFKEKEIDRVIYRKNDDGSYSLMLVPDDAKKTDDIISLDSIDRDILDAIIPNSILSQIDSDKGSDSLIGSNLDDAKEIKSRFMFDGFDALPLDKAIDHPSLFNAYPGLKDIMVRVVPGNGNGGSFGVMDDGTKVIKIGTGQQLSTILHEIQHGIQKIEGFATGGSIDTGVEFIRVNEQKKNDYINSKEYKDWNDEQQKLINSIEDQDELQSALEKHARKMPPSDYVYIDRATTPLSIYNRLAGEVESRNVQTRMGMSDDDRKKQSPRSTQDVKPDDVIVLFNGKEMNSAPTPANLDVNEDQSNRPKIDIPETKARKIQRRVQDSFNRFTVIKEWLADRGMNLSEQADVYAAEERYHAKTANQLEDFREQQRNPLMEKIAKSGFSIADVSDYLLAQHAGEANRQARKLQDNPDAMAYGISDKEAQEYLDKASPKLAALANEVRDITEQTKKMMLDNGLLDKDITDAWEATYQYYVPVKGGPDDGAQQGTGGKGLKTNVRNKRRLGHGKRDESVIENILMDHERAIMQIERNRVGKHLVMMAAEIGMPGLVSIEKPVKRKVLQKQVAYEVQVKGVTHGVFGTLDEAKMFKTLASAKNNTVSQGDITIQKTNDQRVIMSASPMLADNEVNVYMDGHAIRVQINDDLLARAYTKMGIDGVSEIVAVGRMLNGYLSKVYTGYNPEFIITNIVRDFSSGTINLTGEQGIKMAAKTLANYPGSFASLFKYAVTNGKSSNEWIDGYRANGGNTGAAYLSDMERLGNEVKTEYASYLGVMANIKKGDMANASRAAGRKAFNVLLKWIYNMNQAGENAMRLSAFKAMIESGRTVNEAAKVAKNITVNFNRKGEIGAEANAAYLFFNASIQGVAATAHALTKGKHKYQAQALTAAMTTLGYLAAASLAGGDEDEYDKLNDYTKERNVLIKSGDGYVKIPIPYGYGFFWNLGRSMADAQRKDELGNLPWHIATSAIQEFTPFGNTVVGEHDEFKSEQIFGGLLPTALQIGYQASNNKQLFSGGEIMPDSPFDQSKPERERMFRNTQGTLYDKTAGWLETAGFDVSPETLKYMTRTFTGGAGAFADSVVSAGMLKKEGAELDVAEMPFIRKAYTELTVKDDRAAFYKAKNEARTAAEEFNRAKAKNDLSAMKKVIDDKSELIALDKYATKLSKLTKISRDQQDAVRLSDDYTVAEKRLKVKELEKQESSLYDQYLDVFKVQKLKMKE